MTSKLLVGCLYQSLKAPPIQKTESLAPRDVYASVKERGSEDATESQRVRKNEKNAEKGMVIERRFPSAGEDPAEGSFDWIEMDAEIQKSRWFDGETRLLA